VASFRVDPSCKIDCLGEFERLVCNSEESFHGGILASYWRARAERTLELLKALIECCWTAPPGKVPERETRSAMQQAKHLVTRAIRIQHLVAGQSHPP
jgi:hypothetical protein